MDVEINLDVELGEIDLTLRDILGMKTGDIIPFDMPEELIVRAEGLPSFRGKLGRVNDNYGIKISSVIPRPESQKSELQLLQRQMTDDKQ